MSDTPPKANSPPAIGEKAQIFHPGQGIDPAARIAYSRFRFALPKISAGKAVFIWPNGTEAFRRTGSALLGIHKYIGRNYVDVHVIHRDEAHIEMSGTFAGLTSRKNMLDLIAILTAVGVKQLYVPGVFANIQNVYCENYDFNHAEDDRTHSIEYQLSFVRTTTGAKITERMTAASVSASASLSPSDARNSTIGSSPSRVATITDSSRTLREISNDVYGSADQWRVLLTLNSDVLANFNVDMASLSSFQLATTRLPVGTRIRF